MKKEFKIGLLAAIIVVLVGGSVFLMNNDSSSAPMPQNNDSIMPANVVLLSELSMHDSKDDCWVSYKGEVYDITSWLPKHPGSSAAIEPYCGTAAEFESAFSGQHGLSQVEKLKSEGIYKGELK